MIQNWELESQTRGKGGRWQGLRHPKKTPQIPNIAERNWQQIHLEVGASQVVCKSKHSPISGSLSLAAQLGKRAHSFIRTGDSLSQEGKQASGITDMEHC